MSFGYDSLVEKIEKYCREHNKTPLQLDFENWNKMSMILATEEYYLKINKDKKEIIRKKSVTLLEKSKELMENLK